MADSTKHMTSSSPLHAPASDSPHPPDAEAEFINQQDLEALARALNAPESNLVTALNDWKPVQQRVKRRNPRARKARTRRSKDETREGFVYTLLKWPLLLIVVAWLIGLSISYSVTRLYIWAYEHLFTWRGERAKLRQDLRSKVAYSDWVQAAKKLDSYLGTELWREVDTYAYYDHTTIKRARNQLKTLREEALQAAQNETKAPVPHRALDELKSLVEACVKSNFAGIENPRVYSETYYGTKILIQDFITQVEESLSFLFQSQWLADEEKFTLAKHVHTNLGRTALCLSGGASFAYYHFGVVRALLDASLLPDIITGTSGGALVASLTATRTDDELKALLNPALSSRITACEEPFKVWFWRWWKTGARFDTLDWARKCSWFTRGSMTFREAYERTGRILNITCIPSDPHSPAILANYLTAPNCVIWSAVLASAAVPGILNPVVLMMKMRDGTLAPYSFGHKWKDGSLRTDVPIRALNLHFNVNFTIVSQVNPHINLFFFSSRGAVGRPVTHRRGRGWRGGFLGSATEQYLKLELTKNLKVLKHLELLPRLLEQDWSEIWLQNFSGTVTIWPRSKLSDFLYILSDPTPQRLARMLQAGQSSTFPKLLFIGNRIRMERLVEAGLLSGSNDRHSMHLQGQVRRNTASVGVGWTDEVMPVIKPLSDPVHEKSRSTNARGRSMSGMVEELKRQSAVFFDDLEETETSAVEEDDQTNEKIVEGGATIVG